MTKFKKINRRSRLLFLVWPLLALEIALLAAILLKGFNFAVLNPKGVIAERQFELLVFASLLSLVVVIPVYMMTVFIAYRYRAGNTRAAYRPDWDHSRVAETVWWGVPILLITILAVLTWKSSHELDPFRPIASAKQPVRVQVIALQWKWLFIYPEYGVASVNYLRIPEDTPISFELTSDAPMNSFWIPQLGGQVYAMSGTSSKLHLMADEPGEYNGVSANLSGEGFAGMKFVAKAGSQADFDAWLEAAKDTPLRLDAKTYDALARPSKNNKPAIYANVANGLYDSVVEKYMKPAGNTDMNRGER